MFKCSELNKLRESKNKVEIDVYLIQHKLSIELIIYSHRRDLHTKNRDDISPTFSGIFGQFKLID